MGEHPFEEVHQRFSEALRSAISMAMEAAELTAMRRMEQAREAQKMSDTERADVTARFDAEHGEAIPVMHQPWDPEWWQRADAAEIAHTWEVTSGWAACGDPYAKSTLEHMGQQLKQRHGIEISASSAHSNDVQARRGPAQVPGDRDFNPAGRGDPATAWDSRDRNLPGDRDEDRMRQRSREENAAGTASDETAAGLAEIQASAEDIHAEAAHADDMHTAASQDRDAAATLATMADREAADAVAVAAEGFSGTPSARLSASRAMKKMQGLSRDAKLATRPRVRNTGAER